MSGDGAGNGKPEDPSGAAEARSAATRGAWRRRMGNRIGVGEQLPVDPDLDPDDPAEPSRDHRSHTPHPSRVRLNALAAVFIGGAVGTVARYEVSHQWPAGAGHFPTATFVINTTGAFLLGLFLTLLLRGGRSHRVLRPFVATGVLGGWTTYSTLAIDAVVLVHHGSPLVATLYLSLSLCAGLAAVAGGIACGRPFDGVGGSLPPIGAPIVHPDAATDAREAR
jgi:CrcB protein